MKSTRRKVLQTIVAGVLLVGPLSYSNDSEQFILKNPLLKQNIFTLDTTGPYENPGVVDYNAITRETPQGKKIVKEKIETNSGKYVILNAKGSDVAQRWITEYAKKNNHDVVIKRDILEERVKNGETLFESVPLEYRELKPKEFLDKIDITKEVIKEGKSNK